MPSAQVALGLSSCWQRKLARPRIATSGQVSCTAKSRRYCCCKSFCVVSMYAPRCIFAFPLSSLAARSPISAYFGFAVIHRAVAVAIGLFPDPVGASTMTKSFPSAKALAMAAIDLRWSRLNESNGQNFSIVSAMSPQLASDAVQPCAHLVSPLIILLTVNCATPRCQKVLQVPV